LASATTKTRHAGCVKDAEDFVRAVKEHSAGIYDAVITYPEPPGGKWTRDAVLDALDWIKAKPMNRDVAMIFLSRGGIVTPDQAYRFLPYDYDPDRIERTTVRDIEFEETLSRISAKALVFIDTSFSGRAFDKFVNKLGSADAGIVVFTASTGNQLAMENDEWANGAFTKCPNLNRYS
jgi:Caspase domain